MATLEGFFSEGNEIQGFFRPPASAAKYFAAGVHATISVSDSVVVIADNKKHVFQSHFRACNVSVFFK